MNRDDIVPGVAITGLPNVFAAWKVSGSWYYELHAGEWTQNYARINVGTITGATPLCNIVNSNKDEKIFCHIGCNGNAVCRFMRETGR